MPSTEDGKIRVGTTVSEFGQGILTMIRKLVGEELPVRR